MTARHLMGIVLALLLAGCGDAAAPAPRSGEPLRPFAAPSLEGAAFRLPEAAEGKVVVLTFWASWCAPCKREMMDIQPVWLANRDRGLLVLAVNAGQKPDEVAAFVAGLGISYPVLLDPDGKIARSYGVTGLPMTFIVGRDGRVRHRVLGETDPDHLRRLVDGLL